MSGSGRPRSVAGFARSGARAAWAGVQVARSRIRAGARSALQPGRAAARSALQRGQAAARSAVQNGPAAARSALQGGQAAVRSGLRGTRTGVVGTWRRLVASRAARRAAVAFAVLVVSLVGTVAGLLLGGRLAAEVGPFRAELAITPSLTGDTKVFIPPLGALSLDSHDGPAHLSIRVGALDQSRAEAIITSPNGFTLASQDAVHDLKEDAIRLGLRTLGVTVLGSLVLAGLVFRNARRVAWAGGLSLAVTVASLGAGAATFEPQAIEEPRYEGLLVNAPAVVGDARRIANRYEEYTAQLQRLVTNVTRLYATVSSVPVFQPDPSTIKVLHISDMHLNPAAWSVVQTVVNQFDIDLVIDTGDIVDWGSTAEAQYVSSISTLGVPYVFIRGNHDSAATAEAVAKNRNAIVLEDSVRTVGGLTIAGIGDPRFTPDKETSPPGSGESQETKEQVIASGELLAGTIRDHDGPVDIALVHDPASADPLATATPLVLAGHEHQREISTLPRPDDAPADAPQTTLMVEGSTGGAGLRGLEDKEPLPLEMSVLYFDDTDHKLQAYDDITVGGTGLSEVSLERHIYQPPGENGAPASPSGSPTSPSGPASPSEPAS
ncbi:MAG: metallophosphoesterase, partial [Micromonosporaceae bacterium]|nr:metallophosphoesterase [Micromonosporaceae bacterium]